MLNFCYLSILISRRTPRPLIICNDRLFMTTHKWSPVSISCGHRRSIMRMATMTTKRRMMMIRMMAMRMPLRMRTMMMMISREDKIDQRWLTSNQRLYIGWPGRDSPLSSCLSDLSLILGIKFLLLLLLIFIIVILIITLHYHQKWETLSRNPFSEWFVATLYVHFFCHKGALSS